jgi:hypothetical protein
MLLTARNLVLAASGVLAICAQPAHSQTLADSLAATRAPLLTTDRTLQASLNRISSGSSLWREAILAVAKAQRRVLVATPSDVVVKDVRGRNVFDLGVLAEAVPVFNRESELSLVVIVVNLRLVRQIHDERLSVPRDFEADLDRILVHEVYGHAVPYLLAGDSSGRCADPQQGEPAPEACSIRRENEVRAELGLGRRGDSGNYSLKLAMGPR